MTNEQMRQRIAELEEGLRWIASHDNFGLTDGSPVTRQCIDALVARAAALLSAPPPASEPDADVVERVARAIEPHMPAQVKYWPEGRMMRAKLIGKDDPEYVDPRVAARAALSAMRPAIDREKLAEIRRAYDAWRAADTRCALLADPEDEGSPSERQEAAEEAAWAWDQAASKLMLNADALLAMIGGGDE